MLSNIVARKGEWRRPQIATGTVVVGPCFPLGAAAFDGAAGKRLLGKRVRLFGSDHQGGDRRRAFYMEPATVDMPAIPAAASFPTATEIHRVNATSPLPGGWHRAHSEAGQYTVDLPAPFMEVTAAKVGKAGELGGFMLKAVDDHGISFIAVREPNVPDAPLRNDFDAEVTNKSFSVVQFKGATALDSSSVRGANTVHSRLIRVPGATYMLIVAVPKGQEKQALPMRDRFYQSLSFD